MKTTWLNIVNYSSVFLDLNVPRSHYFRMKVLCEDISELSGALFTQQKMIELLWNDFINQVKKVPNFEMVYSLLLERETKMIVTTKEVLLEERKNSFAFFETEKVIPVRKLKKNEIISATFQYRMNRKQALRGEVMLADIAEIHPDHHFTLERVLEIIYCDFIEKYKQGESEKVVEQIVESIE
ncbi:hypothetical protein H1D32_13495 [Anaerobacillus sp. CMMVII]|nr:hypothetical protein [Anaerobacillus sp. CMMVII]